MALGVKNKDGASPAIEAGEAPSPRDYQGQNSPVIPSWVQVTQGSQSLSGLRL